ncbi:hypothetical protein HYH03_017969 [Edaphochlamys debaryana]|uniref:Uncharacterized protein n=1 Tax=Edaphochlamys debaryana TaxID=47281 RepID=A0A836BNT4_9CHLO|nr:hypothetical protein HYH03_017969 [Edaphochlamys debaryana]|eukprot:KAG2483177.1 hypothetical protein HYH03_017969 [Edaphochlamys debaryana]
MALIERQPTLEDVIRVVDWAFLPADALSTIINGGALCGPDLAAVRLVCSHWRRTTNSHLQVLAPACTSLEQVASIAGCFPYLTTCDLTRCDTRLVGHASLCRDASARLASLLGALARMPSLTCLHISDTFSERMGQKHWASLVCAKALIDLTEPHRAAAPPPPAAAAPEAPGPAAAEAPAAEPPSPRSPVPALTASASASSTGSGSGSLRWAQAAAEAAAAAAAAEAAAAAAAAGASSGPASGPGPSSAGPPAPVTPGAEAALGGARAAAEAARASEEGQAQEGQGWGGEDAASASASAHSAPIPFAEVLSAAAGAAVQDEGQGEDMEGVVEVGEEGEAASTGLQAATAGAGAGAQPSVPSTAPAASPPRGSTAATTAEAAGPATPPPALPAAAASSSASAPSASAPASALPLLPPLALGPPELDDPGIRSFARAISRPGATHQHAFWLPDWCGALAGLQELHVRGRQRPTAGLPPCLLWLHAGRTAPQLTSLSLSRLCLATLPEQLQHLTGLTKLVAADCSLSLMPRGIASGLPRLEVLDLSLNGLTALPPDMTALTALRHLDLQRNKLACLPPDMGSLSRLTCLLLNNNQLRALPASLAGLRAVETLSASYNWLGGMGPSLPLLCGLPRLRRLELACVSDVRCRLVPPQELRLLASHLTHLDLAANNLVPADVLGCLTSLRSLNLSDCGLLAVPPWVRRLAPALAHLDLSNNSLAELPPWLSACTRLRFLSIAHNRLSIRVPPAVLEQMPQLEVVESE